MWFSDTTWEHISYALGCSSVLIWLCAQLPQIIKNFQRKSVEGLSVGFLVAWIAGDASNLFGCLLTHQLAVQILLASYYCLVDVVLIVQMYIYQPNLECLDGVCASRLAESDSGDENDNTNHPTRPKSTSKLATLGRRVSSLLLPTIVGSADAMPVSVTTSNDDRSLITSSASIDYLVALGYSMAYFSTGMYLFSRLPQIYHNFQRKSTTGVSMMLFSCAFFGNLTNGLSILLAPQSVGENANTREFLLNELSYLLGAMGTMLFDCIILGQWYWYQRCKYNHHRRGTENLDRIQRPYLGTPRPIASRRDSPSLPSTVKPDQPKVRHWSTFSPSKATRSGSFMFSEHQPLLPSSQTSSNVFAPDSENSASD